ncbi:MAG: protein-L-isoaspartate(D-aspartate) O-methyltransferase [Candidatus Bipolaricaulota bacterium]
MIEEARNSRLERMISEQLADRGITDERILNAFRSNPRHLFVPDSRSHEAYSDRPLPIGEGQTISQPYIVALMTELLNLEASDTVLEIGTGSGFQTAILGSIAEEVFTVERKETLMERAKNIHRKLGFDNIQYKKGDGTKGWEDFAPYDKILATGSVPNIPDSLLNQLGQGGRLVAPAGGRRQQRLTLIIRNNGELTKHKEAYCSFLPLIGEEGWNG